MKLICLSRCTTMPHCFPRPAAKCFAAVGLLALLLIVPAFSQGAAPAVSCESLAKLALPDTTITAAQQLAANEFKLPAGAMGNRANAAPPSTPAFCRVAATLKPSGDSNIKVEVWLPLANWNGKFLGAANGGWAGSISYNGMIPALQSGYAAASTDTGHDAKKDGPGGDFAIGHPEKMTDYGYRAIHEMTLKAKAIVKAYYGVDAKYSYFVGCSLGGMQALVEARRFPEDYNGIVAGAPANPMTMFNAAQIWPAWLVSKDPAKLIPGSKFPMIHEAALKACASPVGMKQGLIDNPVNCHFDPGVLLCKGEEAPDCLTAPQVELMRQIYAGPVNPRTKEPIFPGVPIGGELQLPQFAGTNVHQNSMNLYKSFVYGDPNWDWKTMDFDSAIALARKKVDPVMYADANLKGFVDRGGKLLIYIGWTDYHNPKELADYYKTALKNAGGKKAENSIRYFTIPGMDHCQGGAGCDTFEKLGAIDQWVVSGKAPDQIIASKLRDGKVVRTSPICGYPKVAQYKGTGDTENAENFVCAELKPAAK